MSLVIKKYLLLFGVLIGLLFSFPPYIEAAVITICSPSGVCLQPREISQSLIDQYTSQGLLTGCSGTNCMALNDEAMTRLTAGQAPDQVQDRTAQTGGLFDTISKIYTAITEGLLWITALPVMISGMFLSIAGGLFDYSLAFTILNFSTTFQEYFSSGVNIVWESFRDVGNIIMIGVFVYISFRVMLGMESFGMKSFAARLVIVALLINFSLFFTKIIIDVSNITANQFLKSMGVQQADGSINVSGAFTERAGVKGFWSTGAKDVVQKLSGGNLYPNGNALTYVLITTLFFLAVGSVLLHGAILLLSRMIVLVLLMITSSFAWVAFMTPKLEKYWSMWWDYMIKYAIFAPLYMLLLWAVFRLTGSMAGTGAQDGNVLAEIAVSSTLPQAMVKVAIIVGLLYGATKIADSLSIAGAKQAKSISLRALGIGATPFTAGAAFLGRNSLGWVSGKAQNAHAAGMASDNRLVRSLSNTLLGGAKMNKALENISKSQFQLRDAKFMKGAFGKSETDEDRAKIIAKNLKDQAKKDVGAAAPGIDAQMAATKKAEDDAKKVRDEAARAQAASGGAGGGADAKVAEAAGKAAGEAAGEALKDARVSASAPAQPAPKQNIMEQMARGSVPPSKEAQAKASAGSGETAREGRKIADVASELAQRTAEQQIRQKSDKNADAESAKMRLDNIVSSVLKSSEKKSLEELDVKQKTEKNNSEAITQVAQARAASRFSGSLRDAILKEIGGKSGLQGAFSAIQEAVDNAKKGGGSVDESKIVKAVSDAGKEVTGAVQDASHNADASAKQARSDLKDGRFSQ